MIWVLIAMMLLATVVAIAIPVLRARAPEASTSEYDLTVFTDQMGELERDRQRGLIGDSEFESARAEVGRRVLAAKRQQETQKAATGDAGRRNLVTALIVLLLVPAIAGPLYLWRGNPQAIDVQTVAGSQPGPGAADPEQLAGLRDSIGRLQERLDADPNDFDGWVLLGRSYMVTQQPLRALEAYQRAVTLRPDEAAVQSFLGEALVFAADGMVTENARTAFERAIRGDSQDPAARFYLALADAQAGNVESAFDAWLELARDTPADAPWFPILQEHLQSAARDLGVDLASVLPTTTAPATDRPPRQGPTQADVNAAQDMAPQDREEMIRGMVARLAERLEENPNDPEGWDRLARSYRVLGESEKAAEAALRAQQARRQSPPATTAGPAQSGPSQADIDAARDMSPQDRQEMIRGMVARLAERLEENPNDAEGWDRLARSYRVLGESEKAAEAALRARQARSQAPSAPTPPATSAPATGSDPDGQREMIEGMVAGLAARLEEDPNDREGWLRLTRSYQVLGQPQRAIAAFEKAEAQFPNDAEILQLYARAVIEQSAPGEPLLTRAFNLYRRVLEVQRGNLEALYFVALGEAERGNPEEARRLWTVLRDALEPGSEARNVVENQLRRLNSP